MRFAAGVRDPKTNRPYYMRSECGDFTITIPLGDDTGYGAWRIAHTDGNGRVPAEQLGLFDSAAIAKQACEAYRA